MTSARRIALAEVPADAGPSNSICTRPRSGSSCRRSEETGGNVTQAARKLGISRRTLHRKLKELAQPEELTRHPDPWPIENQIQSLVHKLEEGGLGEVDRLAPAGVAAVIYVAILAFGANGFKGLAHPRVFEQAESRGRSRGERLHHQDASARRRCTSSAITSGLSEVSGIPDTYHAPLWPAVLSPFLMAMMKSTWEMTVQATCCTRATGWSRASRWSFFSLAVAVNFFIARRLFDHRLAVIGDGAAAALRSALAILHDGAAADADALSFLLRHVRHAARR